MKFGGAVYLNGSRYWWKVKLPGTNKVKQVPLKPKGAKFATKDKKLAENMASEIWQDHLRNHKAEYWDGKLTTLVRKYNQHNEAYYLPPSKQAAHIARAISPLADYFTDLMADDFTPLHLKEFRDFTVESDNFRWCRKIINRHIGFIKRMFKWAASEMLISVNTYTALTTVEGLRMGRTKAAESKKVKPADIEAVKAVMAVVTPVIGDMVQIQLLTGMRPGELVKIRPCDIDCSEKIWIYCPPEKENKYSHKTEYLGYSKIVLIGPKAQQILSKYMLRSPTEYCFQPAESDSQARKRRHESRKTPLSCGNCAGTNRKNTRKFNDCYDTRGYRQAIQRACKKAKVEHWYPHQLRHTAATEIRKEFGLDAARAVLGHRSVVITNEYAELDLEKAKKVAKIIG
jgi:integrase